MSEKVAEQFAEKVVSAVRKSGVREDILDALLKCVEDNVREHATEMLLAIQGHTIAQRDKEWLRQLTGEWSPKSSLKAATTPAEVEQEMRTWMKARISEVRAVAYQAGYDDAYPPALKQGIKFGWAAHEAGKGLEDAVKAGEKIRSR